MGRRGEKVAKALIPESDKRKDLGNTAFTNGFYDEAVTRYLEAIELSKENPNHVYFANLANA